jgi:cytochrome P450
MKKEDILSRFLAEKERAPGTISNKYLRDIILNFAVAGRDTTAGTLSWFFYSLCKHPNVQEKILKEIREATKMDRSNVKFEEFISSLSDENLNSMQYLHATLTETLRLYPAVPQVRKMRIFFFKDKKLYCL